MRGKQAVSTKQDVSLTRKKKEKVQWTKDLALTYLTKNAGAPHKGLKFWSAFDYLKRNYPTLVGQAESYSEPRKKGK